MENKKEKKSFEKAAAISLCVVAFLLCMVFVSYYQLKYNLVSDLVPESTFDLIFKPYALQGLLLSLGLLVSVFFRVYKKWTIAFFVDAISIAISVIWYE